MMSVQSPKHCAIQLLEVILQALQQTIWFMPILPETCGIFVLAINGSMDRTNRDNSVASAIARSHSDRLPSVGPLERIQYPVRQFTRGANFDVSLNNTTHSWNLLASLGTVN